MYKEHKLSTNYYVKSLFVTLLLIIVSFYSNSQMVVTPNQTASQLIIDW